MSDVDKMTNEAFRAMLGNIILTAKNNVKSAQLVRDNSNRALDRLAAHDPGLAVLLKQGIEERGKNSQRILDYLNARLECKQPG
jgi:hypothetical protein